MSERFPWKALPAPIASWLRPELPTIAEEMIRTIREEVPDYARPMEGSFAAGLRLGVEQALRQFVDLIENPDAPQEQTAKIFRKLGRGELHEGRSLDALQAAYRVGARVAWRRYAQVAKRAGFPAEVTSILAEAVFTHINDMADESVKGYAEAQASAAGTQQRMRQRLLDMLMSEAPAPPAVLADLAAQAQWPLPETVCCVVVEPTEGGGQVDLPTLPPAVLVSTNGADPHLVVPNPEAPGREAWLRSALRGRLAVLGLAVPPHQVRRSLEWARRTLRLVQRGAIPRKPVVDCADHLGVLLLLNDEHLVDIIGQRTMKVFAGMTPSQRSRLEATLLAWLASTGRAAPEVATSLGIHPQTARYRMHQLMELFGDRLHDPDFRFEIEAALRARALLAQKQPS